MAQQATAQSRAAQTSTVADLARFFPEATPVRIPVQFTRSHQTSDGRRSGGLGLPENALPENALPENALPESVVPESTVIEFGTSREVLFACTMPLEFADVLRLRNSDGSLDTEASVVAVQYHPGATAVAARFLNSVPNWIVKS
ncbi:MAG: hypothetical protein WCA49_06685 [Candidatus Sulfotelmatobacter sp.]